MLSCQQRAGPVPSTAPRLSTPLAARCFCQDDWLAAKPGHEQAALEAQDMQPQQEALSIARLPLTHCLSTLLGSATSAR